MQPHGRHIGIHPGKRNTPRHVPDTHRHEDDCNQEIRLIAEHFFSILQRTDMG